MPAATSSRQLRKQPTEDIEDAMSTQPRDEDVDEDEVPSQPRRSKGAKKKQQVAVPEDDAEDVNDEDPLVDFKDQPVDKQQAQRINGVAVD